MSNQTTVSIGGDELLFFPAIAAGGSWSTDIAIGNNSGATQTVRIDFFRPDGVNTATITDIVLQPGGVFFFSTSTSAIPVL